MKRSVFLFLLCVFGLVGSLHGQTLWSVHDCMVYAVENAPKYKIQELTNQNYNTGYLCRRYQIQNS